MTSVRADGGVDYYRYDRDSVRIDHAVTRVTLTFRRGDYSFPLHLMYRTKTELDANVGDDLVLGVGTQIDLSQW